MVSSALEKERRTAIGQKPMFPGFNELLYSDKSDNFEDGRIKTDDPDPLDQMTLRNQVQLSTYGNGVGEGLKDLMRFMNDHLRGAIGSVHLLPVYRSSGDGGFAPIAYTDIDPKFGTWDDVKEIADRYDLCVEFMVNHISPDSDEFQDFLAKGDDSEFADMFVDWDKFWPKGRPNENDKKLIRCRNDKEPVLEVEMKDGSKRRLWCTFGPEQIDINPMTRVGWQFIEQSISSLRDNGASVIRLDAFGYFTKKLDTRCFFEEPEAWELLDKMEKLVQEKGIRLLCEVHEEYKTNLKIADKGYWVYDFALPLLVLHAFYFQTAKNLRHWLRICPRRQITVLDTHDGMGIDDIAGLASVCDTEELKKIANDATSKEKASITAKYLYDPEKAGYVSIDHQINCTYFSACEEDEHSYLLARAIQFFCPGIPLVYYVGMLVGSNDLTLVKKEGTGRAINRHLYSYEQAVEQVKRPVVQALLELCRFRNQHPAFGGEMSIDDDAPGHVLAVTWQKDDEICRLTADFKTKDFEIKHTAKGHKKGDELRSVKFKREEEGVEELSLSHKKKGDVEVTAPPS